MLPINRKNFMSIHASVSQMQGQMLCRYVRGNSFDSVLLQIGFPLGNFALSQTIFVSVVMIAEFG